MLPSDVENVQSCRFEFKTGVGAFLSKSSKDFKSFFKDICFNILNYNPIFDQTAFRCFHREIIHIFY